MTIVKFYTAFTVRNAWTDITNQHDIDILEKKRTVQDLANIQLFCADLKWGGRTMYTKSFSSNTYGTTIGSISFPYWEPSGATATIKFRKSGNVWQYYF